MFGKYYMLGSIPVTHHNRDKCIAFANVYSSSSWLLCGLQQPQYTK